MTPQTLTPRLLYLGTFVFAVLLVVTLFSLTRVWQKRDDDTRARAIYDLVQNTLPNRPTDTPGAAAWLHRELTRYWDRGEIHDPSYWRAGPALPQPFRVYGDLLSTPVAISNNPEPTVLKLDDGGAEERAALLFRDQFYAQWGAQQFVITRRKALGGVDLSAQTPANTFLRLALPQMAQLAEKRPTPSGINHRLVRFFALSEDNTLATLPLAGEAQTRLLDEGAALRTQSRLPNFVSNEFFFVFDYSAEAPPAWFSGLYLDLGGQGLVGSITAPLMGPDGPLGIIGVDIALDLNWVELAANLEAPLKGQVVTLTEDPLNQDNQPWRALTAALSDSDAPLTAILERLSQQDARLLHNPTPIYHGVVEEQGAVLAFRAAGNQWMLVFFPHTPATFPILPVASLLILLIALLAGFAWSRRRTAAAFAEKQNLLETMRVPLVVMDPNSDRVVFCNRAAQEMGIRADVVFREYVDRDDRDFYESMQFSPDQDRRAYGLHMNLKDGRRYSVVRSVAVENPIDMLQADKRHRLGIIFVIDEDDDLGNYRTTLAQVERDKLSVLFTHGVDSLAAVLYSALQRGQDPIFCRWLSEHLTRRIRVIAMVLERWDKQVDLGEGLLIDRHHAEKTLDRLDQIFKMVRTDADLRDDLRWNNGVLSSEVSQPETAVIPRDVHWPDHVLITIPSQGVFGFFVGEILVNCIRHGAPYPPPNLDIQHIPGSREVTFQLTNTARDPEQHATAHKSYGGQTILQQMAKQFGWKPPTFEQKGTRYITSWQLPARKKHDNTSGV